MKLNYWHFENVEFNKALNKLLDSTNLEGTEVLKLVKFIKILDSVKEDYGKTKMSLIKKYSGGKESISGEDKDWNLFMAEYNVLSNSEVKEVSKLDKIIIKNLEGFSAKELLLLDIVIEWKA